MSLIRATLKNGTIVNFTTEYQLSCNYENATTDASEIRIGVASGATLDFDILNRDNILSNKNFDGCTVQYFDDDNNIIGVFDCSKVTKKDKKKMSFQCQNNMLKFEKTWIGATFPITIYDLLLSICNQCGVSLITDRLELPNADVYLFNSDDVEGITCREILKYVAEVSGTYATITPNGFLKLTYYDFFNEPTKEIHYGDCTAFKIEEKVSRRAGVLFINSQDNVQVGDTSASYIVKNNPIIGEKGESEKIQIGNNIVDNIKFTSLRTGEFTLRDNGIRQGDVFKVYDENNNEFICVASSITLKDHNNLTIRSYGDTPNARQSTSTSTSSKSNKTETYSKEVYLGRGQNHQYIEAKGGTFVLCEKLISNITTFTKVNLQLFVNFNYSYSSDKIIYFDIYANEKLAKRIKHEATQGFNQCAVGFLADVDLEQEQNIYSVRITLEDNEIIEIQPFECQMSFIVKSAKIDDAVAADQYFIERYEKIPTTVFNQDRFTIKNIRERTSTHISLFTVDYSPNQDGSVVASYYADEKILEITGSGPMYDNSQNVNGIAKRAPKEVRNQYKSECETVIINGPSNITPRLVNECTNIKKVVIGDSVREILGQGGGVPGQFEGMTYLEEVNLLGSSPIQFNNRYIFKDTPNLTTITGTSKITKLSRDCFNNCGVTGSLDFRNLVIGNQEGVECFRNMPNVNYLYLPMPICDTSILSDLNANLSSTFNECNADGVFWANDVTYYGRAYDGFNCFENSNISIIYMPGVSYDRVSPYAYYNNKPSAPISGDGLFLVDDASPSISGLNNLKNNGWDVRIFSNKAAVEALLRQANETNMASIKASIRAITTPII